MALKDDLILEIGEALAKAANDSSATWTACALVCDISVNDDTTIDQYLFEGDVPKPLRGKPHFKEARAKILQLRQVMRVDGDVACPRILVALKRDTLDLRLEFEFDDMSRWKIDFHNVHDQQKILFGEIWPEDFT